MKYFAVFLSLVFFTGCVSQTSYKAINSSFRAGIFESYDCKSIGMHGSHQLEMNECKDFRLLKETTQIPMAVGVLFGFNYEIKVSSLASCYTETRVLEHPPMTQPDGQITTSYTRSSEIGYCPDVLRVGRDTFSWHIEKDWEAVKGEWVFKILVNGKQILIERFIAY